MDIIDKMLSLKEILKTKIEHALKDSSTETIVAFAKDLDLVGRLEKQYREIETALISLDRKVTLNIDTPHNTSKSYKKIGKEERLICINEFSERTYFIFPPAFCAKYQDKLSTDKKEKQIKFNVLMKKGIYTLIIPDSEPIIINEYIDKFDNIPH